MRRHAEDVNPTLRASSTCSKSFGWIVGSPLAKKSMSNLPAPSTMSCRVASVVGIGRCVGLNFSMQNAHSLLHAPVPRMLEHAQVLVPGTASGLEAEPQVVGSAASSSASRASRSMRRRASGGSPPRSAMLSSRARLRGELSYRSLEILREPSPSLRGSDALRP
jgi:hypothetical protein